MVGRALIQLSYIFWFGADFPQEVGQRWQNTLPPRNLGNTQPISGYVFPSLKSFIPFLSRPR